MYEVEITRTFSAAHQLRGYNGDCSKLHGHNYEVLAVLQATELDDIGIAVDFKKLKKTLDAVLDELDHSNISEHPAFEKDNPTSENLARFIYYRLSDAMNDGNVKVARVRVGESSSSGATYYE